MSNHPLAKGGGNAFGGDVIMRWPDPAACENEVMRRRHGFHGFDDHLADVGDYPRLAKLDTLRVKLFREPADVPVLGASG